MSLELKGTIKKIGEIQTFASGFQKREFVIVTNEQFPQPIMIELLQDKVDIIEPFKIGDEAEVGINLRGREWVSPQGDTRYFNSILGWKITRPASNTNNNIPQGTPEQAFPKENPFADDGEDDLPF